MIDDKYHSEEEEIEEQSLSQEEELLIENADNADNRDNAENDGNDNIVEYDEKDDLKSELEKAKKIKKFDQIGNLDLNLDASFYSNRYLEVEQLKSILKKDSNHGLTGIKNLGNSCYISTIIQCLSNTLDFCYFMISNMYTKEINNTKTSEMIKKGLSKYINIKYN